MVDAPTPALSSVPFCVSLFLKPWQFSHQFRTHTTVCQQLYAIYVCYLYTFQQPPKVGYNYPQLEEIGAQRGQTTSSRSYSWSVEESRLKPKPSQLQGQALSTTTTLYLS